MNTILLAVGPHGVPITVPEGVELSHIASPVESGEPLSVAQQQEIVRAALAPLREMARGHRRAVILVGDLSQPAPYDIALPPIVSALVEADIRPTRIAVLVGPAQMPVLGRAAIHRYGEETVGEHELRAWKPPAPDEEDPLLAAADLRIALSIADYGLRIADWPPAVDLNLELVLGRKAQIDIVRANLSPQPPLRSREGGPEALRPIENRKSKIENPGVFLTSGGGSDWEETLEEALLSLWHNPLDCGTAVLAFSGHEGLGSAHFTLDLWALLEQAEQVLSSGEPLTPPAASCFDPALALAAALSSFSRIVLFSSGLAEHTEGEELAARLAELPRIAQRLFLCAHEAEMWEMLARWHGQNYRLRVEPLGWRAYL